MFERSKLESLRDVSVTRIGGSLSYGFPQAVLVEKLFPDLDPWTKSRFLRLVFRDSLRFLGPLFNPKVAGPHQYELWL